MPGAMRHSRHAGHGRSFVFHGIECQAFEKDVRADLRLAGVQQDIETLPWGEKRFGHRFRPLDQAAIGADDGELQLFFYR